MKAFNDKSRCFGVSVFACGVVWSQLERGLKLVWTVLLVGTVLLLMRIVRCILLASAANPVWPSSTLFMAS